MNLWYVMAIVFGALTAFCGYYGSVVEGRRSAKEQAEHITTELSSLGDQIQALRIEDQSPSRSKELADIEDKHTALAREFFQSLPLRTAEQKSRDAEKLVKQIKRSGEMAAFFRAIEDQSRVLVTAYNESAGEKKISIEATDFPPNVFDSPNSRLIYILFRFQNTVSWALRFTYQDATPVFQLVRLSSPEGSHFFKDMTLTNDSINLLFVGDNFSISLNRLISDDVRRDIVSNIPTTEQPNGQFVETCTSMIRRMIEFQLLRSLSTGTD